MISASLLPCSYKRSEASLWAASNAKQKNPAHSRSDLARTRTAFQGNLFASQKTTQPLRASLIFRFVALTTASRSAERVAVLKLARVANEVKLSLSTIFLLRVARSFSRCFVALATASRCGQLTLPCPCSEVSLRTRSKKIGGDSIALQGFYRDAVRILLLLKAKTILC